MRILVAARKQIDGPHLWALCSKLVAKSGLPSDVLQKHLPADVVVEIELIRQKTGYHGSYDGGSGSSISNNALSEQRTKRMQKALDSSDVELVNMMVMGEGLNLDKALALHYAVSNCSRWGAAAGGSVASFTPLLWFATAISNDNLFIYLFFLQFPWAWLDPHSTVCCCKMSVPFTGRWWRPCWTWELQMWTYKD